MLAINGGKTTRTRPFPHWPQAMELDRELLEKTIRGGKWADGGNRAAFEERFAADNKVKHCFAVTNGTVSLELILRAYGIGRGDEVILPPYTFVATLSSVVFTGAMPVFADIDPDTFQLSADTLEERITDKTKAIIAVAVGGCPPDIDAIEAIAKKHGVKFIVDAAQGVAAEWNGTSILAKGDAASVSCQNSKNLTSGEGGIITTNDDELASKLALILDGGRADGKYVSIAQNYRMNELCAVVLSSQYDKLAGEQYIRERNAAYLAGLMKSFDFISPCGYDDRITKHSYHLFLMKLNREAFAEKGITRAQFLKAMCAEWVPFEPGYKPLYSFACTTSPDTVRTIGGRPDVTPLKNCEEVSYVTGCWFYQSMLLGPRGDIDLIAEALDKVWKHADDVRKIEV
nr:DegT/DnrJ/EryC1/StrS family aminotransferase [Clostridia bacterium]